MNEATYQRMLRDGPDENVTPIDPAVRARKRAVCQWAKERIEARDFIVLDTESTDLDPEAEVVSIAIVNAWGRLQFSTIVSPIAPIDHGGDAYQVNGISEEMARRGMAFWQADGMISAALPLPAKIVIAYNAAFDKRMLEQSRMKRGERPERGWNWQCAMLKYAEYQGSPGRREGDFKWHKLANACEDLGIVSRGYHDAAGDALACWEIVAKLAERAE